MKINFTSLIILYLFSSPLLANINNAFLEDVSDITQIEFSDGSLYQGQVSECLLNLIVVPCMHGKGVYTLRAGSKYAGEFSNNKPTGQG